MRNVAKNLDTVTTARVALMEAMLRHPVNTDREWSLTYVKRDGSVSAANGKALDILGTKNTDTRSVMVETERGTRTINLCRVTSLT